MGNSTAIAEVFSRIDHKFDLMSASARSCTGTLGKAWKKASSLRHARTWQHWRKIMRRSVSRQPKARARRKDMATSSELRGLCWQSSARQHALKTRTVDEL